MIKVIIFDLGGVLFTNGTKKFIEIVVTKYGAEREVVIDLLEGDIGTAYREAKISREVFWQILISTLEIDQDMDTLEDEWISGYHLIEGTRDLIQELSKKYKVYFLSDNVRERIDKVNNKYDFLRWFEGGVFSHEVGHRKPHPDVYKKALEVAGVSAEEAVFIDDKPKLLVPAKEMGMLTFAFESPEKLRSDLVEHAILDN